MDNLFERASRAKVRFPCRGLCTVEDLWDLDVEELDGIYKNVNRQLRTAKEESLLDKETEADALAVLQVELVKHVVEVKLAEAQEWKDAKKRKEEKQKLLGILAGKKDAELQGKSVAELQAMIDAM